MLLPHITKKQIEIQLLIFRFRFLNRIQIQKLLHHKDEKRINEWLKDLTEKGYLVRILNNEHKVNIIPAIYYIGLNGIRFLKTQPNCEKKYINKLYSERKRSDEFINRCLLIADIYIYLTTKYIQSDNFEFYTQSDFTIDGIIKEIFPDFVYRKGKEEPYYVAQIFLGSDRRRDIRSKIQKFITFFTKGEWAQHESLPKILLICPDNEIEEHVIKKTKKFLEEEGAEDLPFFITTKEQIQNQSIEGEIWERIVLNE